MFVRCDDRIVIGIKTTLETSSHLLHALNKNIPKSVCALDGIEDMQHVNICKIESARGANTLLFGDSKLDNIDNARVHREFNMIALFIMIKLERWLLFLLSDDDN